MRLHMFFIGIVALPVSAFAQIGNPGFMAPDTRFEAPGVQAPNQTNETDRLFARLVTEGSLAEVTFGELAAERAGDSAVGDFARRMIEDHTTANEDLAAIAGKSGIPLPEELNADHAAMLEELEGLEGADFDLAYMQGQVIEHQKTVLLLTWEITFGQDAELKRFASATLPTVMEHLEVAREIKAGLAGHQVAEAMPPPQGE